MDSIPFEEILRRVRSFSWPKVDLVVGIAEGGVVPASLVAFQIGCDFTTIAINFRDENNAPRHHQPILLGNAPIIDQDQFVLLVDDVSVSGQTLSCATEQLKGCNLKTFVLRGKADYVLFPELDSCVRWPWVGQETDKGKGSE